MMLISKKFLKQFSSSLTCLTRPRPRQRPLGKQSIKYNFLCTWDQFSILWHLFCFWSWELWICKIGNLLSNEKAFIQTKWQSRTNSLFLLYVIDKMAIKKNKFIHSRSKWGSSIYNRIWQLHSVHKNCFQKWFCKIVMIFYRIFLSILLFIQFVLF